MVELDETRHPVVVLRTGDIDGDAAVDDLIDAFERLFAIGPVGLVLHWGRVAREARRRIGEFRSANDERFKAAVSCTASVVAPAALEANRTHAAEDPSRAGRAYYAATEADALALVQAHLAGPSAGTAASPGPQTRTTGP